MKFAHALLAAAAITAIASVPAYADGSYHRGHPSASSSGGDHGHPATSSSGGDGHSSSSSSSGGTSIPEPSDAILLLMGAAGVVIGRRLHARAKRKL
jgi:hypothetical protein